MSPKHDRAKRLAKKRERKKLKRKDVAPSGRTPLTVASATPAVPTKFVVPFGPDLLQLMGPMVRASWTVPHALAARLTAEGKAVPALVDGFMLVDTGAQNTCIASRSADDLGLRPIDVIVNHGAHGPQESPVFRAHFHLAITDEKAGTSLRVSREMLVAGIPGLQETFARLGVKDALGNPVKVIGLIGRDFLRHARMVYDGPTGHLELELDLGSLQKK